MPPDQTLWFKIPSGPDAGRIRLRGWMLTAIGDPYHPSGLVAVGICPLCSAMVMKDTEHAYGDRTWNHEQWHAGTDCPVPESLTGKA